MSATDVTPPHCYARAQRALGELRLIREEMGRSEDTRPLPVITGATPREVYFAGLAFYRRADRLAREHVSEPVDAPPAAPQLVHVRPEHVLGLVSAAVSRLESVKTSLGIVELVAEPALEPGRQPSDVLMSLMGANRALDRLLERPFTPADVHRQVALSSAYATRLLEHAGRRAPSSAVFERRKRPQDCYERLVACHEKLRRLVQAAGQTSLEARGAVAGVVPGDVHDLACLVLGETALLQSLTAGATAPSPFEPAASGHRLPSHVYQAASTLEAQLAALL